MIEKPDLSKFILDFSSKLPMICPYCKNTAHFKDGLWRCNPCNALAKTHKGTEKPIGTLANQALWNARKTTLKGFGSLMDYWLKQGLSKTQARKKVITDLSNILNISHKLFNIDCFNEELCEITNDAIKGLHEQYTPICPYCESHSVFVPSKKVYRCDPCDAQVGVHKHNNSPLGGLANAELRIARAKAHSYLDPLWRYKVKKEAVSASNARKSAYQWLADQMKLKVDDCHIGEFNLEQCQEVLKHCRPYISNAMSKLKD